MKNSNRKSLKTNNSLKSYSTLKNTSFKLKESKISDRSSKQKTIDSNLKRVYEKMSKSEEQWCTGCGSISNLEHSHIIPRSRRRDLVTEIRNITLHCRECHLIWEHGRLEEKKKLDDFTQNIKYIKEVDKQYYQLILKNE